MAVSKHWLATKKFLDKWDNEGLPEINPSYAPRQEDILKLIDLYWVNKFKDGDISNGLKKSFFNVVNNPTELAQKLIDLDTKDIRIIGEDGRSYYPAWLMSRDLKVWMKDKKNIYGQTFGQFLNKLVYNFPKYGHIVAKKAKDTVHLVPLQNIRNKQGADCILASDLVIEEHHYTPYQALQQGWDKDKMEYIIKNYEKDGEIIIYETHGDMGTSDNYAIVPHGCKDSGDVIFKDAIDRNKLYKEVKWDDILGRAMGRGRVELLFEDQIAKNQTENMFRAGLRWSSKRIFQSKDDTLAKNLITQVDNGDILTAFQEILPIQNEERNLAAFNWADQKWDSHVMGISFSYPEMGGERPPAGTPLGTSVLQTNMAGQYYDLKKEELGLFIKDILFDWIIPEFAKDSKQEHGIMVSEFDEDEMEKFRNLITNHHLNTGVIKHIAKTLKIPTREEYEILKSVIMEQVKKGNELKIPKNYYKDLKYKIDILITNEQIDTAARMTTLQTILQIIGGNPTILQDPRSKKIFYKLIDLVGFSPVDFGIDETFESPETAMVNNARMGGSVAKTPTPTAQPATLNIPQRL